MFLIWKGSFQLIGMPLQLWELRKFYNIADVMHLLSREVSDIHYCFICFENVLPF